LNITQIITKINWLLFGDSTAPTSVTTHFAGVDEEFIADMHRQVQTEWDYWFMENLDTQSIAASTQSYALPTRFKRELSLWITNSESLYEQPLQRLMRAQAETTFRNPAETAVYPTHYEIWGATTPLKLWPIPSSDSTLNRRYYAFLQPPVKGTVTMTIATPCVVTLTSHGLVGAEKIFFTTTGALPTGLSANTTYWVTKVDANTFNLSTSLANYTAGTFIATSGTQSGVHTMETIEDTLTNDHPYVIIYKAALILAVNLDYQQKIPIFSQLYQEALNMIRTRDWEYKRGGDQGGLEKVDYVGF
jgi:hypothetical protein